LAASVDPRVTNTAAFKVGLKKLPDAARARNVVLSDAKVRRVVELAYEENAALGWLIETMATTGARRSQVARLTVGDLQDGREPRLMMPSSLKGKGTKRVSRVPVPIPASLAAQLRQAAGDRPADALLLLKPDGSAWGVSNLRSPFRAIVEKAGLDPAVATSYSLRHSSITRQLLRGVPIRVVAHAHDTSVPMIEKSYSALISDHSDALHRAALLDLGAPPAANVVRLKG
jgi:integrase